MALFQRSFLYVTGSAKGWQSPADHGLPQAERITLKAADSVALAGWWIAPKRADSPVFLYFHGNADGLSKRAGRFKLMTVDGAGVLALNYRGYGASEGSPTEATIHADARLAYAHLLKQVTADRIVIFGESLGTGVALNLARQVPARAIILDSPFYSVLRRAQATYPWLPVSWLLVDTFRSDLWIGEAKSPILILHGAADDLIPPSDSEHLAKLGKPNLVTRKLYPGIGHVVPYDRGPDVDVPAFLATLPRP